MSSLRCSLQCRRFLRARECFCSWKRHVETPEERRKWPKGLLFQLAPIFLCHKIKHGGYNNTTLNNTNMNKLSPTQNTPALQATFGVNWHSGRRAPRSHKTDIKTRFLPVLQSICSILYKADTSPLKKILVPPNSVSLANLYMQRTNSIKTDLIESYRVSCLLYKVTPDTFKQETCVILFTGSISWATVLQNISSLHFLGLHAIALS